MKRSRMSKLFLLLVMAITATFLSPQLHIDDDGLDVSFVEQAFAEGEPADPPADPQPKDDPKPKNQPGKKDEEEDDEPDPKEDPDPKDEPMDDPEPKDDDDSTPISRQEYNDLKTRMDQMSQQRQAEVVQRRVDHAVDEQLIDAEDEDAVAEVRELAKNDASWKAYKKIASPRTPAHVTAKRFQAKNLKSNKHTGDSKTLDTVLEHQKD